MRNYDRLSWEEEVEFFRQWQAMPDGRNKREVADRYLSSNLNLVRRVVATTFGRFSINADRFDELVGIGWAAMYQAMLTFDVERKNRFSTYANIAIWWAIRKELSAVVGAPVSKGLFLDMLAVGLGGNTGSALKNCQLANAYQIAQAIPLSTPLAGKFGGAPATDLELIDHLRNQELSTEEQTLSNLRNQHLYQAISRLSDREQTVIVAWFFRGDEFAQIGRNLSSPPVSRQRAEQLTKSALAKLRLALSDTIVDPQGP